MTTLLNLTDVRFRYDQRTVLRGVEFALRPGEFVALVGPNGSGKTTLLQCMAGILPAASGAIVLAGYDLQLQPQEAKRCLGYCVSPHALPELLTGNECMRLFARARGLPAIPDASRALTELLALAPHLDRHVSQYSLGMRQKLGIALGLLGEPPLLLLDEPMNGLDPRSAFVFKQYLRRLADEHGVAIVLATHALEVAERFIDRALLLVDGRIVRDWQKSEIDAIRRDPENSLEQTMADALA